MLLSGGPVVVRGGGGQPDIAGRGLAGPTSSRRGCGLHVRLLPTRRRIGWPVCVDAGRIGRPTPVRNAFNGHHVAGSGPRSCVGTANRGTVPIRVHGPEAGQAAMRDSGWPTDRSNPSPAEVHGYSLMRPFCIARFKCALQPLQVRVSFGCERLVSPY